MLFLALIVGTIAVGGGFVMVRRKRKADTAAAR
jgi:LPXTG-motif cell wall-anchored protein